MVADLIHHIGHDEDYLEREMKELVAKCNAALAAPPRNCDRPECATYDKALDAWVLWRENNLTVHDGIGKAKQPFPRWLLAPAAEEKGGNDEQK